MDVTIFGNENINDVENCWALALQFQANFESHNSGDFWFTWSRPVDPQIPWDSKPTHPFGG